ncbi:MurR/RpiR family transcriptional regulator [Rhodococcus wratislaviensis]|uniref:MurR/RpiR family transcriptional regulator n=1 Tax=Rhodococcus wratislaviensis TaxID=44752 RepID=UPI003518E69A
MTIEEWLAGRGRETRGASAERVVNVLVRTPHFATYSSVGEIAERAQVNVSTVVRTAQQLGFDGWPSLREELRAVYLSSVTSDSSNSDDITDPAAQMLRQDATNLAALNTPENREAIHATAQAIRTARRTLVISSGSGAAPAHILSYLGSVMGYDIRLAAGPPTVQAAQIARLQPGDCLITLNIWRLTRALRDLTRLGRARGATVSVVTDLKVSPLAADADHLIVAPIEGIAALPSLTSMVATVHAILAELTDESSNHAAGEVQVVWDELDLLDRQL